MKQIRTEDAAGHILCHDITRIVRGETKDAAFRKGHVVRAEDIPLLLQMGKEHLYVWENAPGMLHENDAAEILAKLCRGDHIGRSAVKEGKINLTALAPGLLKIDREKLSAVNGLGQIIISTRHGNFPVAAGDILAGVRVVPLVIDESKLSAAQDICGGRHIMNILPFREKKAGVITTGSEVLHGRIQDTFTPVVVEKLAEYHVTAVRHAVLGDEHEAITKACVEMLDEGLDLIVCAGGMSVDPDDRTPMAIRNTGARVVSYGAPVLPGAMFMLAYYHSNGKDIPVVGLPGCVMYARRTIFDLILPRLMADDPVSEQEILSMGHGGLCLSCQECTFPKCGFGK